MNLSKKFSFFFRVNDYIRSGLDSKNLIDPDGGINLENKRRGLGLQEEQETATLVDFSTKGFVVGINSKLHVGYPQIWKFDSGFWNDILPKLENFYFNHLFPELVYPRIFHSEMRWNKVLEFPRSL